MSQNEDRNRGKDWNRAVMLGGIQYVYCIDEGDGSAQRVVVTKLKDGEYVEETSVWFSDPDYPSTKYYLKAHISDTDLELMEDILEYAPEKLFDPDNVHEYKGVPCVTIGANVLN